MTGGVGAHLDVNVAAALDPIGGLLGVANFSTSRTGHTGLLARMSNFGPVARVGVEGTGSYRAGLARFLLAEGLAAVEVDFAERAAYAIESRDLSAAGWIERQLIAAIEANNDAAEAHGKLAVDNTASSISTSPDIELAV